jgi:ornithine carbamoyltransferase
VNLKHLTELSLKNCTQLDDWAFDKLFRVFRNSSSLKKLDVSGCTQFSDRALGAVHRRTSLREVVIKDTAAAKYAFVELVEIMLQDIRPDIRVVR